MTEASPKEKSLTPSRQITPSVETAEAMLHWLKTEAIHMGFEQVGVVDLNTLQQTPDWLTIQQQLDQWLAQGLHADMAWMARYRELRHDPRSLMPNAQTALVVTLNYAQQEPPEQQDNRSLKVSTYAWGKDYHKVIRRRLAKLLKAFQAEFPQAGIDGRAVTDSAPILEKALAVQAGLGWQGKNTLIISPQHGSQFFIGELLLNIALPATMHTMTDHCGRCQRCIEACPTQALNTTERVLDSARCISYWTIESDHATFPDTIQHNLQGWTFGCDICQQVCPWNQRFSEPTTDPAFEPRQWAKPNHIQHLSHLDLSDFQDTFQNSPLRRAGRKRLYRNITQARSRKD